MESILIWSGVLLLALLVFVPYWIAFRRGRRLALERRAEARADGAATPSGQYPQIDIQRCIGCGTCVQACPEGDVLGIVSGKAEVINGLRCIGHARCADVCCVGAIKIGLGNLRERPDIPLLTEHNETSLPGVYIAGELSGFALISNAVKQGQRVIEHLVAGGITGNGNDGMADVVIVGAGPSGLSAALTAQQHGLQFRILDQQDAGGTILHYPRQKLVMVQPVEIPRHGPLEQREYSKEELLDLWRTIISHNEIEVLTGERFLALEQIPGGYAVRTQNERYPTRRVVLALGRRGTPRKLGVPGENLAKVTYQLVDAHAYQRKRVLVVGGGDSAVEIAIALARQTRNTVTLSYRRSRLSRVKKRNAERIESYIDGGRIEYLGESQVTAIQPDTVELATGAGARSLPNDYVFICAGGVPPYELLASLGITFGGRQSVLQD